MPIEQDLHHLRANYEQSFFDMTTAYPSPFQQFLTWFEMAQSGKIPEPNAMVLSTASKSGIPSSRVVLLKEFNENGFVFFTNYASRKGNELEVNPNACINFWWGAIEKQIRIEGVVEKISDGESEKYFYSRPIGSQAGAVVSPQSKIIENREWLENKFIEVQLKGNIKRPLNWGGYNLIPNYIEFWQGRTNRLHDRLSYIRENNNWKIVRLAP